MVNKAENWGFYGRIDGVTDTWSGYPSEAYARDIADKIAKNYPGVEFTLFKAVATFKARQPVTWTEIV